MKRLAFIITSFALIATGVTCYMYYHQIPNEANKYISAKRKRLQNEAKKQVDSLFVHTKKDIFTLYYDCKPRYVKGDALAATGEMFKDIHEEGYHTIEMPADVITTYRVAPQNAMYDYRDGVVEELRGELRMKNSDNDGKGISIHRADRKGIWQTGWALGVRENWISGRYGRAVVQYIIIPYAVSFRKAKYGSFEDFISIDEALNNAYDFYVKDDESDFKRNIVADVKHFLDKPQIDNEYFTLEIHPTGLPFLSNLSSYADYTQYVYSYANYVFIRAYGRQIFDLNLRDDRVKSDKQEYIQSRTTRILALGLVTITLLIAIWCLLLYSLIKNKRNKNRTLLQRIISQSSPKKFLKNYNSEKLNSANHIYAKAISIGESDMESIVELAKRVETELGVHLFSEEDIRTLKKACDPKRFMRPYDAERIAKANSLYARLEEKDISLTDILDIESEAKSLSQIVGPGKTPRRYWPFYKIVKPKPTIEKVSANFEKVSEEVPKRSDNSRKSDKLPINNSKGMFRRIFTWKGRISRTEYCITYILYLICYFCLPVYIGMTSRYDSGYGVFFFAVFIMVVLILQGIKRCHDMGHSGWFILIPVFNPIWLMFSPSDDDVNEYGTNPKIDYDLQINQFKSIDKVKQNDNSSNSTE